RREQGPDVAVDLVQEHQEHRGLPVARDVIDFFACVGAVYRQDLERLDPFARLRTRERGLLGGERNRDEREGDERGAQEPYQGHEITGRKRMLGCSRVPRSGPRSSLRVLSPGGSYPARRPAPPG